MIITGMRTGIYSLGAIMAFRMLGLFMILPVFSVAAHTLAGANARLIGLALGSYGLTQALLQIPFGILSDRIGRKPVITLGLLLFAGGSILAALSHNIYYIILGRALQGGGAIGSTVLAFVADLSVEEKRVKAMAIIGLFVGSAFSIAMIIGPIINAWYGLSGIFWITALLAIAGIIILYTLTPQEPPTHSIAVTPQRLYHILQNKELLRLNFGIFTLHAILTALFIMIPIVLTQHFALSKTTESLFYLAVLIIAFILMLPFIIIAEKKHLMKPIFIGAIVTLCLTQLSLLPLHQWIGIVSLLLLCFFTAFNLLEASLPSLIAKTAPKESKGAAMGVYSSSQFLGIFIGGSVGGFLYSHFDINGVLLFNLLLATGWLVIASSMHSKPLPA